MAESHDSLNGNLPKPATAVTDLVLETRKIGSGTVETIDARRLHAFLEVGRIFAAWLPDRIDQYGFVEGVDYLIVGDASDRFPVSESKRGGHNRREYALTLDMAKELSMVERNAKGKEARRYFIECEKRAKAGTALRRSSAPRNDVAREHRLSHAYHLKIARMCGLSGNQAVLSANRAAAALTGVDTLGLMGISHLDAPQPEALLTPTDIGHRAGLGSARAVNMLLCGLGYQVAHRNAKGHIEYEPTQTGIEAGGVMQDTGKRHSTGAPVRQLRWASSIVRRLASVDLFEPAQ